MGGLTIIGSIVVSTLSAFVAFILGQWVWKRYNSPNIEIGIPEYSSKKPKHPQKIEALNIEIFVLQVNNKGRTAAKNSLLYFNIEKVNKICKWNSVPEPSLGGLQFSYDIYQRLTILPKLPDRAAFVFRFSNDEPYILRQYDLSVLYGSKDIDKIKEYSNEINCKDNIISGNLVLYSENYQGKCKISFSYSEDEQKISISLSNEETGDYKGYRMMQINEENSNLDVKK